MLYDDEDEAVKLKQVLMAEAQTIAAKHYSAMREGYVKWGFSRHEGTQQDDIEVLGDSVSFYLSVQIGTHLGTFPVNSLRHRISLKRSFDLFAAALSLWELLNPFHIKGLSKVTWLKLNEFLYKQIANYPDVKQAQSMAHQDTVADFQHSPGLIFIDYYDSLFEFIDSSCKSKLTSEYVRLIKRIYSEFSSSRCLDHVSLHTKHQLEGILKPSYAPWMLPYMKELKKLKTAVKADRDELSFVRKT
jgi:hypothetical protein